MKKLILSLLVVVALAAGCKNDLVVNAPYENITVVYSLLSTKDRFNQPVDTHYVKINKAFLGEGDALLYAQIPDSNEFQDGQMTAQVEEWDGDVLVATFDLTPITVGDRDIGVFYYPEQTVYYFVSTLNEDHEYRIVVNALGETVTASTDIVDDFNISAPDASPSIGINFIVGGDLYADYVLNWTSATDGRRYEASYRFRYKEVLTGNDTTEEKSFVRQMGNVISTNTLGGEEMSAAIPGEDFFIGVRNLIPDPPAGEPQVIKRIFVGMDLLLAVANDDFHTYLSLADPISGIVEERPTFTNITNGEGLFASRYFKQVIGKRLSDASLNELLNGTYTGDMLWCAAASAGPPYGCTP